jgi:hypothetical protein
MPLVSLRRSKGTRIVLDEILKSWETKENSPRNLCLPPSPLLTKILLL